MKNNIGSGVLLLKAASNKPGVKFGFQLSKAGILLTPLGENSGWLSLRDAVKGSPLNAPASVTGQGHLLLSALPASPNDAFYGVQFEAKRIGTNTESFSISVQESAAFAHGPQCHFSDLNLVFQYDKANGLSIASGGSVAVHLHSTIINNGATLRMTPALNAENGALVLTADPATTVQLDTIGILDQVQIELGTAYDRWAQLKGLYAFDGGLAATTPGNSTEIAAHDSSGQGAPSLYFDGKEDFTHTGNKPYGAQWTARGIAFAEDAVLANPSGIANPVISAIQESESFSVELWVKPTQMLQEGPAQIFAIESSPNTKRNFFLLGQGPWTDGKYKKEPEDPAGAYLNVTYGPPVEAVPSLKDPYWEKPFISPAGSLGDALMQVIYTYDQKGTTHRLFVNGVQIAEKYNPGDYNNWLGKLRLAVGNALRKNKPWSGEIHRLAIYNRSLTPREAALHYSPSIRIRGDFSLNNVIPPLQGVKFPCELNLQTDIAALTASRSLDLSIKSGLGLRHARLECSKTPDGPWAFSGTFRTRFWEELVDLDARMVTPGSGGPARLLLTSQDTDAGNSSLGRVALGIGAQNTWELRFGEHQEYGVVPLVLDETLPAYREFTLGHPHITFGEPITLDGIWLGERVHFESTGTGAGRVLKGSVNFTIPFTLELPPRIDPETGDAWGDAILLDNVDMAIELDITLQHEGFLCVLKKATFEHAGQTIQLAERRIYVPPVSKLALLSDLLEEVKAKADTFFGNQRRHSEDYYLDLKAGNPPYIHLSKTGTDENLHEILLPRIFATDPAQPFTANSIFTLSQTPSQCSLSINTSSADAAGLRAALDNLVTQVEGQNGLSPAGLRLLQYRIAERLSLDYDNLLYFHYGWDRSKNYIDLHPGMRLRVDFQNYQFVHITEQRAKKGFTGSGSIYIPIHSYTHNDDDNTQYLGFGPFLSGLNTDMRGDIAADGAGGLFDLAKTGIRKPFFRLYFPNESIPAAAPERAVTLVGADHWQDLPVEIPVSPVNNQAQFFFRDKAMITPEIQVFVGNREVYVPIGTTMRQLLEQYANIPMPLGAQPDLTAYLGKNRPRRLLHTGPDDTPAYRFLNLKSNAVHGNRDILDLPLLKGDKFYF